MEDGSDICEPQAVPSHGLSARKVPADGLALDGQPQVAVLAEESRKSGGGW